MPLRYNNGTILLRRLNDFKIASWRGGFFLSEQFLIEQIIMHSQTFKRFRKQENAIKFYERLESLRVSKGFNTQDEALDYAIEKSEGAMAA